MPRGQQKGIVQVSYAKEGECLEAIMKESFQAFIYRNLQGNPDFLTKRP